MENNFKILLNNAFLYDKSTTPLAKNYIDLTAEELLIFEQFLRTCYKKFDYRNKESWWTKANSSKKIDTDTARYFEDKCIWNLHINQKFCEDLTGKTINYEIYPGKTAKYVIYYYKEKIISCVFIHVLSFSEHPHGYTWTAIEHHISKVKYF